MGFADEVAAATVRVPNLFEAVCEKLRERGELEEFLEALDDPKVPGLALERVLKARGVEASDSTLLAWRRKRAR